MAKLFDLNGGAEITSLDGAYGFYIVTVDGGGNPVQSGFVTLDTLKTFINTDPTVIPSSNPWRGCRVNLTATQSIANAAFATVSWQAEDVDTDSIWSIGSPTRLTVPTGVTKVRLTTSLNFDYSTTGNRAVSLRKNGTTVNGGFGAQAPAPSSTLNFTAVNAASSVLSVTAGDYFELRVAQTSGGALNLLNDARTWFEMEILEASA